MKPIILGELEIKVNDECMQEYANMFNFGSTLEGLKESIRRWRPIASEAYDELYKMDEAAFKRFRSAMLKERAGQFSGGTLEEATTMLNILMPAVMCEVTIMAQQFHVPWGAAFYRMLDVGLLKIQDGIVVMDTKTETENG